jgi:signal peptidase II
VDELRLLIITALIVIVDQVSKYLVVLLMEVGDSISLVRNFLHLTYVLNPGAAFGMLPYQTLFFVIITVVVIVFIVYYYRILSSDHRLLRLALALQLGGAVGNLIDRLRTGYVIDFIDFKVWPPVFNLADSAIVIGIGLFIIAYWRDDIFKTTQEVN